MSVRFHVATRERGVGRELEIAQALGDAHVVGVAHAVHAVAHLAQVLDVGVDEGLRVERRALPDPEPRGDDELRVRLHDVVHLDEGLDAELPVHREAAGVPLLGPHRLELPRLEVRGGRFEGLAHGRGVVVEVDPRAAAPGLAAHRYEVEVFLHQVVLGEGAALGDRDVLAVEPVAPSVERAPEATGADAAALDELHAPVAAGVLEGDDLHVVVAHDDDRLVEELVLDEVARLRDLFEPARHLPHARPEALVLEPEELRVVVALLGHAVSELHRVGHRHVELRVGLDASG